VAPRWWALSGLLMTGLGGIGLWVIVTKTVPTQAMSLIFLVVLAVTLVGVAMPVAAYLNHRFAPSGWYKKDPWRLLRQSGWVGIYGFLCGWLQKEDFLNWTIAAIIASVLVLMEIFFLPRS
jgi:hypothetical protein